MTGIDFFSSPALTLNVPPWHARYFEISLSLSLTPQSCKLIPVILLNVLLYRRKFKPYKYAVVALVSCGIALFMVMGDDSKKKASRGGEGNASFGLMLLGINLLIDGLTNSTQDEIFSLHPRFSGQQMMFNMNFISLCLTFPLLATPPAIPNRILQYVAHHLSLPHSFRLTLTTESFLSAASHHNISTLQSTIEFIIDHPTCLVPLLQFALLGGLGQLFIFETISHFGSLTLVMLTVTRKLVTMLLSVFVFGHHLTTGQWSSVAVVFTGIGLEAAMKRKEIIDKQIAAEQHKSRLKAL